VLPRGNKAAVSSTAEPGAKTRRPFGDWVLHAPQRLRALVRADEVWLALLAAVVGTLAGLGVSVINLATAAMHTRLFALPPGQGLSESAHIDPLRALLVPVLGGAVLGITGWAMAKWRPRPLIDPVEANALYGGRMSLTDSVIVAGQTTLSNGVGASVGMEAGYAQLGGGIASYLGRSFRLRRSDLRVLVGCGAAGAIGGAFSAPLCGSFYGIELIIGVYSIATLPFVVIAAVMGTLTVQLLMGGTAPLEVLLPVSVPAAIYPVVMVLGLASGLAGIAIMRGVTLVEQAFRRTKIPLWARPILGGAVVGVLGCITPMAMSSGHSALHADINVSYPFMVALGLLLVKALASAFSIGSGFRGGLFFASLFLGALFGKVFAGMIIWLPFLTPMPNGFYAVVGMSALAVAIVGGPMTMTFLALESTENFSVTMAVLAASIMAAITVRRLFGYSFTTWRFHLRGEAIRSAVDIGWIQNLTVRTMMRKLQHLAPETMTIKHFRERYPLGTTQLVVVTGAEDRYAGIVYPAEVFGLGDDDGTIQKIVHHSKDFLLPQMNVKQAIAVFEAAEADALPVLDSADGRLMLGLLTEKYALRRYSEELERSRRETFGEL
jgi:CIC family chloride channel protein